MVRRERTNAPNKNGEKPCDMSFQCTAKGIFIPKDFNLSEISNFKKRYFFF